MFRVNPAIWFVQKAVREGWLGEIVSIEADMNHSYGDAAYPQYVASLKGGLRGGRHVLMLSDRRRRAIRRDAGRVASPSR